MAPSALGELTDEEVFGTASPPPNAQRELSDDEVFGTAPAAVPKPQAAPAVPVAPGTQEILRDIPGFGGQVRKAESFGATVAPDPYNTKLTPQEEPLFQAWKQQYAPKDSGADYDLRGAFKAGLQPDPQTGHWPDTFKKPNHPTFSDQSMYAKPPFAGAEKAGHWAGPNQDQYEPAGTTKPAPQPMTDSDIVQLQSKIKAGRDQIDALWPQIEPISKQIDALKGPLDAMKGRLAPINDQINALKPSIDALGAELKGLDDQQKAGKRINIDAFNKKVRQYNDLVGKQRGIIQKNAGEFKAYDDLVQQYQSLYEPHADKFDAFNTLVSNNRALTAKIRAPYALTPDQTQANAARARGEALPLLNPEAIKQIADPDQRMLAALDYLKSQAGIGVSAALQKGVARSWVEGGQLTADRPKVIPEGPEAEPLFKGDPSQIPTKLAYQFGKNFPELAGGIVGGRIGAETGPFGAVAGAAGGAALTVALQKVGGHFAEELQKTPKDPDGAYERAWATTGEDAAATGVSWMAFGVMPFKGAIKNILFQGLGMQPAVAAATQEAKNVLHGRPEFEGTAEAAAETAAQTPAMLLAHGIVKATTRAGGTGAETTEPPPPGMGPAGESPPSPGLGGPGGGGTPKREFGEGEIVTLKLPGAPKPVDVTVLKTTGDGKFTTIEMDDGRQREVPTGFLADNAVASAMPEEHVPAEDVPELSEEDVFGNAPPEEAPREPGEDVGELESSPVRVARVVLERTLQEQEKRKRLLADSNALKAYAKEKGISEQEMRDLLQTNLDTNAPHITTLENYLSSPGARTREAAEQERAKGIKFVDLGTKAAPVRAPETSADLQPARDQVKQPVSPEQAEAGNYKKGHVANLHGMDIVMGTPKGVERSGTGPDGEQWSNVNNLADYGSIKRTAGADSKPGKKEGFDVYIGPNPKSEKAYVIDQIDPRTGEFDELKGVLGADTPQQAAEIYDDGFSDGSGPARRRSIKEMPVGEFRDWVMTPGAKKVAETQPIGRNVTAETKAVDAPTTRPLDDDKRPIFRKGERVVITDEGPMKGRHGTVVEANGLTMANMFGGGNRRTTYHYTIKTDEGYTTTASRMGEETEKPAKVVSDPVIDGHAMPIEHVRSGIDYAKRQASKAEAAAGRTRKRESKESWLREATLQKAKASKYQAALDAWTKKNPELAKAAFPAGKEVPTDAKPGPKPSAPSVPATYKENDARDGVEVEFAGRPDDATLGRLKGAGFRWSKFQKIWYARRTPATLALAKEMAGEKPAPPAAAPPSELPTTAETAVAPPSTPVAALPTHVRPEWREIGKNADGRTLFEDQRGVRSYVQNGIRLTEPVGLQPIRGGGIQFSVDRKANPEYEPITPTQEVERQADEEGARAELDDTVYKPSAMPVTSAAPPPEKQSDFARGDDVRIKSENDDISPARDPVRAVVDVSEDGTDITLDGGLHVSNTEIEAPHPKGYYVTMIREPGPRQKVAWLAGPFWTHEEALAQVGAANRVAQKLDPRSAFDAFGTASRADGKYPPGRLNDELGVKPLPPPGVEPTIPGHGVSGPLPAGVEGQRPEGIQRTPPLGPTGRPPQAEDSGGVRAPGPAAGAGTQGGGRPAERPTGAAPSGGTGPSGDATIPAPGEGPTPGTAGRPPDASVKGTDYRIEPGEIAEDRGPKAKALDNLKAIETVKRLKTEGRLATREEQAALARYVGWGGLSGAFKNNQGKYGAGLEDVGKRLAELLTPEEYATAARSTQYAHYTAEHVIRSMWDAVAKMGFKGGAVFEPGVGIGHFLGMAPGEIAARMDYQGIEMDHLTADIAKMLYPESGVRQADFTQIVIPENQFDLVIGNPPFADTIIKADPKYAAKNFMLHDYFFAKSMDSVRPGGLLAFVTSAGTMNKIDNSARLYLAERAEFLGGVRLPSTAFKQNAGTEVTTDILFFKKRDAPISKVNAGAESWAGNVKAELPNAEGVKTAVWVNRYFAEHPEQVLGKEGLFDKLYKGRYAVHEAPGTDLPAALAKALDTLPKGIYTAAPSPDAPEQLERDFDSPEKKDGSFYLKDGKLWQFDGGMGRQVPSRAEGGKGSLVAADRQRVLHLIPIRDALREVFSADLAEDMSAGVLARSKLNAAYDAFVAKFGPINKAEFQYRRPTIVQQEVARAEEREAARARGEQWREGDFDATEHLKGFVIEDLQDEDETEPKKRRGPSWQQIARLRQDARLKAEAVGRKFDEGSFDPAEMPDVVTDKRPNIKPFMDDPESYRLRAIEEYNEQTNDARKRRIFYESVLTKETEPDIRSAQDGVLWSLNKFGHLNLDAIAEKRGQTRDALIAELGDSVFQVPGAAGTYQMADEYLSGDIFDKIDTAKRYAENDATLMRNVAALEAAKPAPLPPTEIRMSLGMPWIPAPLIQEFAKDHLGISDDVYVRHSDVLGGWTVTVGSHGANWERWGTADLSASQILQEALNRTRPRIYYKDRDGKSIFDPVATQSVSDRIDELTREFADYDRSGSLLGGWIRSDEPRLNSLAALYNNALNRVKPRLYDGSYLTTPGVASDWKWRPHQRRVVARIILSGDTYVAHAVGAGKTSVYIGAGMEMRRLGLVKKPMYVVPNHMLGQFTKEFYEQYPTAKIMVADERRFHTSRRKQFVANVAQQDLDGVVITESAFGRIPISSGFQHGLIEEELDAIEEALKDLDKTSDRITIKKLENKKEKLQQRMQAAFAGAKDQTNTFEELGVDFLFVDEAHCFPYDTLVTTDRGPKKIGDIVENGLNVRVASFDFETNKIDWRGIHNRWRHMRRAKQFAIIKTSGGELRCTTNHQIFVEGRGYVRADDIRPGEHLRRVRDGVRPYLARSERSSAAALLTKVQGPDSRPTSGADYEIVQGVQRRVLIPHEGTCEQCETKILHDILPGAACDERYGAPSAYTRSGPRRRARPSNVQSYAPSECRADAGTQSNARQGRPRENAPNVNRPHISGSWGQWPAYGSAAAFTPDNWFADGISSEHQASARQIRESADELQSGFGRSDKNAGNRGGWEDAPPEEMAVFGSPEDGCVERIRVVSVEILERGSEREPRTGGPEDQFVYDLGIEGEHNYFANGFLVHNSFRKLDFASRQNIKGIDGDGSRRSFDLYSKVRYLNSKTPGRSVVMGSGTPVTNTMGELYTLSKYMQRDALAKRGMSHFDSWAASFGEVATETEPTPQGTYDRVTRFSRFVNAYELYKMVSEVMDIVTPQQLEQYVVRPKIKGGKRELHLAPKTPDFEAFQQSLVRRVEAIKARKGPPQKGDDILLSVINDGRHAAIDLRFVQFGKDDPESKLNQMIATVVKIYNDGGSTKFYDPGTNYQKQIAAGPSTQMIFSNLGVNPRGPMKFSGYEWIKRSLIAAGVSKDHIAIIGDYKSHIARQKLFNDMNAGKVRILLGSTQKMGTGVNAQRRLAALHNLDPLWFPSDDEQRIGRGLRQGNWNPELAIHDYATKGTYDEQMWQMMGRKARFIEQFFRGDPTLRTMEDLGEASFYEQASAIAASDERVIRLTELKHELEKLQRQAAGHDREQYSLRSRLSGAQSDVEFADKAFPVLAGDIAQRVPTRGDDFRATIGKREFTKRTEAADALGNEINTLLPTLQKNERAVLAELGGFVFLIEPYGKTEFHLYMRRSNRSLDALNTHAATPQGMIRAMEDRIAGIEDRVAYWKAIKADALEKIASIQPQIGKEFGKHDEIKALRQEITTLERQIRPQNVPNTIEEVDKAIAANSTDYNSRRISHEEYTDRSAMLQARRQQLAAPPEGSTEPMYSRFFGGQKAPEKVGIGADLGRMIELFGPKMYGENMPQVTVKELLQNSFDAVKAAVKRGDIKPGEGKVDIEVNTRDRTIRFNDNGAGMTPQTVKDALLTVAGTNKDDLSEAERSGGLGLAKLAFIFGNDGLVLATVRDGVITHLNTNSKELLAGNATLTTSPTSERPGTTITVKVPEKTADGKEISLRDYESSYKTLNRPLIGDVEVTFKGTHDKPAPLSIGRNLDLKDTPKVSTAHFPWGDIDIYMGNERQLYPDHTVLSSGMYQFDSSITTAPMSWERLPYKIILDVRPRVKAADQNYPFNNQREDWSKKIENDIHQLYAALQRRYAAEESIGLGGSFARSQAMPVIRGPLPEGRMVQFKDLDFGRHVPESARFKIEPDIEIRDGKTVGYNGEVSDATKGLADTEKFSRKKFKFPDEAVPDKEPYFHSNLAIDIIDEAVRRHGIDLDDARQFFAEIGTIVQDFRDAVVLVGQEQLDARDAVGLDKGYAAWASGAHPVGVSIDKEYHGVHIRVPFTAFFVNPLSMGVNTPDAQARSLVHTMFHEAVHTVANDHGEHFTTEFAKLEGAFEEKNPGLKYELERRVADTITRHQQSFLALRQVFHDKDTKNAAKDAAGAQRQAVRSGRADRLLGRPLSPREEQQLAEAVREGNASRVRQGNGGGDVPGSGSGLEPQYSRIKPPTTAADGKKVLDDTAAQIGHNGPPGAIGKAAGEAAKGFEPPPKGRPSKHLSGLIGSVERQYIMPRTLAATDWRSAKFWDARLVLDDEATRLLHAAAEGSKKYVALNPIQRKKLHAVEELSRLKAQILPDDGMPIVARSDIGISKTDFLKLSPRQMAGRLYNTGIPMDEAERIVTRIIHSSDPVTLRRAMDQLNPRLAHSKFGDVIDLDAQTTEAYHERRDLFRQRWRDLMRGAARKAGWGGDPDPKQLRDAADVAERQAEKNHLNRLADLLDAMAAQERLGYVPLMRFGDYYIWVQPKAGNDNESLGGFPRTIDFRLVDSAPPFGGVFAGTTRRGETPKAAQEAIDDLRKHYPESQYEIGHGYIRQKPELLRTLDIPAIEKLLTILGQKDTELFEPMVDEIQKQMYEELTAGFKRRASNVPGYCIAPETRLLRADMSMVEAGNVKEGDELVGFEEHGAPKCRRKMLVGTVERVVRLTKPCVRIRLQSGRTITASQDHQFLGTTGTTQLRWVKVNELRIGDALKAFPFDERQKDFDSGWLSGFIDGEGHFVKKRPSDTRSLMSLGWDQKAGPTLDRSLEIARHHGLHLKIYPRKRETSEVVNVALRTWDSLRCLQLFAPGRLVAKRNWTGAPIPSRWQEENTDNAPDNGRESEIWGDPVVGLEYVGQQEVVGIKTSCGTFVAEGVCSHNSSDFTRASGTYLHWTARHIANQVHGENVRRAQEQYIDNHPDRGTRQYWTDWQTDQNRPATAMRALQQFGFYWELAGNPSSTVSIGLHGPEVATYTLGIGLGASKTGMATVRRYLYPAIGQAMKAVRVDAQEGIRVHLADLKGITAEERAGLEHADKIGLLHSAMAADLMDMRNGGYDELTDAGRLWTRSLKIAASNIAVADRINRIGTWLAAYRMAKNPETLKTWNRVWFNNQVYREMVAREGVTPAGMARFMVDEALFVWGKKNQPQMQRHSIGPLLFQFHGFEMRWLSSMIRNMFRMGNEGRLTGLAQLLSIWLLAGALGLPFLGDIEKLFESLYKWATSIDPMIEARFTALMADSWFGKRGAEMVLKGPSRAVLGIDLSRRLGFGNVLTDIDLEYNPAGALGAVPGIIWNAAQQTAGRARGGQDYGQWAPLLPNALRNPYTAFAVYPNEGVRTAQQKRGTPPVVPPSKIDTGDKIAKALGFQPSDVARAYENRLFFERLGAAARESAPKGRPRPYVTPERRVPQRARRPSPYPQ